MQSSLRRRILSAARNGMKRRDRLSWSLAALEPRLLLAGDAAAAVATSVDVVEVEAIHNSAGDDQPQKGVLLADHVESSHSIVFVDSDVADSSLFSNVASGAEVILMSADQDAISQITETLSTRKNVASIHLVSHGGSGQLKLSGQILDASAINARADQLAKWSFALAPGADILLYGCEVGAGSGGEALLRSIANLTGADVAASIDLTGARAQGGNWALEKTIGAIESGLAFQATVLGRYQHTLPINTSLVNLDRFSASDPIRLNAGASFTSDGRLQLTSAAENQAGSAFYTTPVTVTENPSFQTSFSFEMSGGAGASGADGLAFVLQNSPQAAAAVGGNAWQLGYGGIVNSIAIELDTWKNGSDQFNDEIAVTLNGDFRNQIAAAQSPINLNSGSVGYAWIDYDGATQTLSVFVSDTNTKPASASLTTQVDLSAIVGDQFYAGFTAGNYNAPNAHQIHSWSMEIQDDDGTSGVSTFNVEPSQLSVGESAGQVQLQIKRSGDISQAASVAYQSIDQSATAGSDYTAVSGIATFAANQAVVQVEVSILDDLETESAESFIVSLSDPTDGVLGTRSTTTVTIYDNEQAMPSFPSFANGDPINLNGGASIQGGKLQLTSDATYQAGTAFFNTPIAVHDSTSFQTSFAFEITGGAGPNGADGFTLVLQNSPQGSDALGQYGSGIGYRGIGNSVVIEFDTWKNGWDQFKDEIAVTLNGDTHNQIAFAASPLDLNSGAVGYAWVDYNGENNTLSVYVSSTNQKPATAVLTTQVDLPNVVGNQLYAGFSASNYNQPNAHRILSWAMTVDGTAPEPPAGAFVFENNQVTVNENAGQAILRIRRTGDLSQAASIQYQTQNQSATAGDDYTAKSGIANFGVDQSVVEIAITILDDLDAELLESFTVSLSNPVGAELNSPQKATVTILDNEQSLPSFASFGSGDPINLNGGASIQGGKLQLTSEATYQAGTAFFNSPIAVHDNTSFQTSFAFEITGGAGPNGADGFTLVLQNSPQGSDALGQYGSGIGYRGIGNSVVIEFDTWKNGWDQFKDEIAVTLNGDTHNQIAFAASPLDLNSGAVGYAWVDYNGENNTLSVYVSSTNQKPATAVLTTQVDLPNVVGNQLYAGFSASNYNQPNAHRILSWSMNLDQPTDPANNGPATFSLQTSQVTVSEAAGEAIVGVVRTGNATAAASINYQTYDQTAIDGSDYLRTTGTLNFVSGQRYAEIRIPILNDTLEERAETFSVSIDNPVDAEIGVPRTAIITLIDDEQPLPSFVNFDSQQFINVNGNATVTGGNLQLTSETANQRGSAYFSTPVSVTQDTSFQTSFTFQMDGGAGAGGADGIAFLLQNSAAGLEALGRGASGIGYDGIGNSIAIELDTWKNGFDKYSDEIAIVVNGKIQNPLAQAPAPINLNLGGVYHAWVDYNGISNVLAVYISETSDKPGLAVVKATVALDQVVGDQMYVGFSASDYDRPNRHAIKSWWLNLETPIADPPVLPSGEIRTQIVHSGLAQPTAIDWSADGRNLYVSEKAGVVKVFRDGQLVASPIIDISGMVNHYSDRGLLDVAVHPDLASSPYMYLLYTYDPPEVWDHVGDRYAGPDGLGNRAGRLMRITLDAGTNYTTMVAGSETILLGGASTWANFNGFTNSVVDMAERPAGQNPDGSYIRDFINSDSTTHTIASLEFAPDGSLFVSIGDGASYNQMDPRAVRVQDIDSLSGKILRIDPITGQGLADNPFFSGDADANRSKVYQLGLRNPFRIAVDDATGRLFIGDVGWTRWEEINTGDPGTNFGWPYYEGGQGYNIVTPGGYLDLPSGQAFLANGAQADPAIIALSHAGDGINAIVMGDVIRGGDLGLLYEGDIIFNDLGQGIVRRASVNADGQVTEISVFTTGAQYVVDMRQGVDGEMYFVDLADGQIGRWELV
ncbi:Soluble aldose sugar dehydrogenase YliI precursor [Novipirellula galeiformis]|uniref:Soluble aldose sugar dehydrogenase YliI n=1 Tax=Novipirellula galeiformis TaxID=2528004 RepID=A0A5C6CDS5_9BACT|nr:Calx-beta domain-containing protein [Novipirellula galeiformis]TWU23043.1 Soluble aldose sugar dehydrogenase YliI precursor [Novipirellula galeiformis]